MKDRRNRRTAVVVAYACEPEKGSEPGAGWGMVMALNEFLQPIVLTRSDSIHAIEEAVGHMEGPVPEFVVVEEASWGPWARKTNRVLAFLAYLAWLRRVGMAASGIMSERRVDAVHHVTYSPYWLPTPIGRLPAPSIWGPIGGAVVTPRALHRFLGPKGRFTEWFDRVVVRVIDRLPSTRRSWREVSLRMVQNRETLERLRTATSLPAVLFNHGVVHTFDHDAGPPDGDPYAVWLSPMESRKGPELAIRAMAEATTTAPLRMVGDGPERSRMEQLVEELGCGDRIEFLGRVPHEQAIDLIANASVAVYTGMREEGGMALAEGLLLGTPTVLLDNGGPAVLAGAVSDPDRVVLVDTSSADGAVTAIAEAIDRFTATRADRSRPLLDRAAKVAELESIYDDLLLDVEPHT